MMATAAVFWGRQRLDADGADADPRRRAEAEVADSVLKQWGGATNKRRDFTARH